MPRRKTTKKTVKPLPEPNDPQIQTQQQNHTHFINHEIEAMERQIGAIRAVRDVKIENLLTELRLLRSCFSEEQLTKPVLEVFEETLPNLEIVSDEGSKKFEVAWKEKESMNMSCADGRDLHVSLLQRLSMAYPQCSASVPHLGGFEYSSNAGGTSFLGADNVHLKDMVFEAPSETQTLAMQEGLQTPGVTSQRLSVGMTPKTLRLPKPGEMLLSVHGSPLGVFKENNMEAINESEEG
ncbi:uncharacterized protein LOC130709510 [Lotus japonicus]|uniref:uncharacterized protein LOC130709510 n=1 Tax=Lotus japonicus TaxID=34305 RepID=UPI0025833628|nr:uncharacterized protein LOC130709510 [Lotus japonicus]